MNFHTLSPRECFDLMVDLSNKSGTKYTYTKYGQCAGIWKKNKDSVLLLGLDKHRIRIGTGRKGDTFHLGLSDKLSEIVAVYIRTYKYNKTCFITSIHHGEWRLFYTAYKTCVRDALRTKSGIEALIQSGKICNCAVLYIIQSICPIWSWWYIIYYINKKYY